METDKRIMFLRNGNPILNAASIDEGWEWLKSHGYNTGAAYEIMTYDAWVSKCIKDHNIRRITWAVALLVSLAFWYGVYRFFAY